jgi:hypothetical protein
VDLDTDIPVTGIATSVITVLIVDVVIALVDLFPNMALLINVVPVAVVYKLDL